MKRSKKLNARRVTEYVAHATPHLTGVGIDPERENRRPRDMAIATATEKIRRLRLSRRDAPALPRR